MPIFKTAFLAARTANTENIQEEWSASTSKKLMVYCFQKPPIHWVEKGRYFLFGHGSNSTRIGYLPTALNRMDNDPSGSKP